MARVARRRCEIADNPRPARPGPAYADALGGQRPFFAPPGQCIAAVSSRRRRQPSGDYTSAANERAWQAMLKMG